MAPITSKPHVPRSLTISVSVLFGLVVCNMLVTFSMYMQLANNAEFIKFNSTALKNLIQERDTKTGDVEHASGESQK